jgi:hypothetical protein
MSAGSSRSQPGRHGVRVDKMSGKCVADLTRDLEAAQAAQERRFIQIVRHVSRRSTRPVADMMAQIHRDKRLCALLTNYETESEIVGMIDVVRELIVRANRRRNPKKPKQRELNRRK